MPSSSNFNTRVFSPYVVLKQDTSRIAFTIKSGEGYTLSSGITVGSVIRFDPTITSTGITGGYTLSQANSDVRAEVIGVVESIAGGAYTVVASGSIKYPESRLNQITGGGDGGVDVLFLSETIAGGLTGTIDVSSGQEKIVKPVIQIAKHGEYNGIVTNYIGYKTGTEATVETADQFVPVGSFVPYTGSVANLPENWIAHNTQYTYSQSQQTSQEYRTNRQSKEVQEATYELYVTNSYNSATLNGWRTSDADDENGLVRLRIDKYFWTPSSGDKSDRSSWTYSNAYQYKIENYKNSEINNGYKIRFKVRQLNLWSQPEVLLITAGEQAEADRTAADLYPEALLQVLTPTLWDPLQISETGNQKYAIWISFWTLDSANLNEPGRENIDQRIVLYDSWSNFDLIYNNLNKLVVLDYRLKSRTITDAEGRTIPLVKKIANDSFVYKIPQQLTINDLTVEDVFKLTDSSGVSKTINVSTLCSNCGGCCS